MTKDKMALIFNKILLEINVQKSACIDILTRFPKKYISYFCLHACSFQYAPWIAVCFRFMTLGNMKDLYELHMSYFMHHRYQR